jgi:hypothetical protein
MPPRQDSMNKKTRGRKKRKERREEQIKERQQ